MTEENTVKLKPCPFCGAEAIDLQCGTPDREGVPTAIMCFDCGAVGPWQYVPEKTSSEVIIALLSEEWNERV